MFVSPSKIKRNKILKNRTLSFETPTKTRGNMVIIPSLNKDAVYDTLKGPLFRPMQLLAAYTPRRVKPEGKSATIINQKDYYDDLRVKTNGRIKKCKTMIQAYGGYNLFYDIYNDYIINKDFYSTKYRRMQLQRMMYSFFEREIANATDDSDYTDAFLVFPLDRPFDSIQRTLAGTDFDSVDPATLFIQSLSSGKLNLKAYEKIKLIIFYVPKADILLAFDIHDPDFEKEWDSIKQKIRRLNGYLLGQDDLSDEIENDDEDLSPEDRVENRKEAIKQVVFSNIAKTIHANNLTDFEAATRDERDLMAVIDKKIDDYIAKPENLKKTLPDLISSIENDNDVKTRALRYVETKKVGLIRTDALAKGMTKETDIVGSLQDLDDDSSENTPEVFNTNVPYIDKRVKQSRLASFDDEYNKKQSMKDLTNVVSNFSNNEYSPMTVDSITIEDSDTDVDDKRTMHVRYKTDENKTLSFQIDIPKIVDKRYLYLSGNKKVIKKQLIRLPIVKTKPYRVEITTNLNKITIERSSGKLSRKNAYLLKKLKEVTNNPAFQIEYGDNTLINSKMGYSNDFEYEELASAISTITSGKYYISFNRDNIGSEIAVLDIPDDFITKKRTPLGFEKVGDNYKALIYIEDGGVYKYDIASHEITKISDSMFSFLVNTVLHLDMSILPSIGKSFVYTKMKFLAVSYPILPVIASQVGLTNILKRYGVEYYKTDKQQKKSIDYVEVKFKDCYLYYKDEMKNTLLLNALYLMDTEEFNYVDFDADIPYTRFFMKTLGNSIGIHTRNMLRINLSVLVDPITRDILLDLKQPTNIIDMLLYANTLLVGNQYKTQNDLTNYRIRSNEIIPARLYGILADAYINYARHKMNGSPINLVVPKGALISALMQEPNINDKSTLNPVIEAEQIAQASAKGYRGVNLNSAYTLEMRAYDDSMQGIISGNATPYSGQAGITRSITYDPEINSVRGYISGNRDGQLSATNMLSPTELLSSFTAAGADPPRQAMQVAQTGHTMPIMHPSKQLIGSGMNKTLAYMISDDFCFKAKKPGIVQSIDTKNKVVILKYDDGTFDAIDLDDKLDKNSGMGFYIHQVFKIVYKEGEHFDINDVIAYNPSYFTGKGKDVDYCPGALAKIAISPGDFSFEDSTMISETLSKKCAAKVNMLKQCVLGKNATIYDIVKPGDKIKTGEHLIEFTSSFDDPDTAEFLQALANNVNDDQMQEITHETIDSKYSGEITRVEIFYNCPFEELSPSLQKLIKQYKSRLESRAKAVAGIPHEAVHIPPLKQTTARRIGKAEFPQDGGVIINIFVEYIDEMGMGDKLVYYTALKGVCSKVLKVEESPISDYRPDEVIEGILTPTGIISRMTSDIYSVVFGNKVLVECGKQIREIWRGER